MQTRSVRRSPKVPSGATKEMSRTTTYDALLSRQLNIDGRLHDKNAHERERREIGASTCVSGRMSTMSGYSLTRSTIRAGLTRPTGRPACTSRSRRLPSGCAARCSLVAISSRAGERRRARSRERPRSVRDAHEAEIEHPRIGAAPAARSAGFITLCRTHCHPSLGVAQMLAVHGFWSPDDGLCLWAEDSDRTVKSPSQALRSARPHPFAAPTGVLGGIWTGKHGEATLLLPSLRTAPLDS